jgi:hypothetical protein
MSGVYKIHYEGQLHQVDADTLLVSLLNITTCLKEINTQINIEKQTDRKLDIKINAFSPGSFIVELHLGLQNVLEYLFNGHVVETTAAIVSIFVSILKIKAKFLKDKEIGHNEKDGKVEIHTESGDVIVTDKIVYQLYRTNKTANDCIAKSFDVLANDPGIDSFGIYEGCSEYPIVSIPKDDFDDLKSIVKIEPIDQIRYQDEEVVIRIVKLSFEENHKWSFVYRGIQINAKISCKTFIERLPKSKNQDSTRV